MGTATMEVAAKALADMGLVPRQVPDFYQELTQALKLPEGFTVVGLSDFTDRAYYTIMVSAALIPEPFLPDWELPRLECVYTAFNDGEHPAHTELTRLTIWRNRHDRVPSRVLWPYQGPEVREYGRDIVYRLKVAAHDLKPGQRLRDVLAGLRLYDMDWPADDDTCVHLFVGALVQYLVDRQTLGSLNA